jgi:hypothetical protein
MTITMDGKAPLHIPHRCRMPKSLLTSRRVKFEIFGIINSGENIFEYVPHFDWWPRDANLAISFLWQHIRDRFVNNPQPVQQMYLQTDNCARDNKNKWIFGFLGLLVHFGYFQVIEIHMLPPGHSHEKVLFYTPCTRNANFLG